MSTKKVAMCVAFLSVLSANAFSGPCDQYLDGKSGITLSEAESILKANNASQECMDSFNQAMKYFRETGKCNTFGGGTFGACKAKQ